MQKLCNPRKPNDRKTMQTRREDKFTDTIQPQADEEKSRRKKQPSTSTKWRNMLQIKARKLKWIFIDIILLLHLFYLFIFFK